MSITQKRARIWSRRRHEEGFTLIELLVVVIIIGILAAIAIPTFLSQRNKANESSAKSNVRNAASAIEAAAVDFGGDYTKIPANQIAVADFKAEPSLAGKLTKVTVTSTSFCADSKVGTSNLWKFDKTTGLAQGSC